MTSIYLATWCQLRHLECQVRVTTPFIFRFLNACSILYLTLLYLCNLYRKFLKDNSLSIVVYEIWILQTLPWNCSNNNEGKLKLKSFLRFFFREINFDQCEIQSVPLATEPKISLIILPLMRILQRNLKRIKTHFSSFLTQRTYSCYNFVAVASLVLELLKKCRVR
jgi:hypothetical protein